MRGSLVVGSLAALLVVFGLAVQFTESAERKVAMADDGAVQDAVAGGVQDAPEGRENDLHVRDLALFAVAEHNKKANTLLEFEKLVKVKEQVVAGTMYYFTIEVNEGGGKKLYEAKVWEKPWMNFKQLEGFEPAGDCASS